MARKRNDEMLLDIQVKLQNAEAEITTMAIEGARCKIANSLGRPKLESILSIAGLDFEEEVFVIEEELAKTKLYHQTRQAKRVELAVTRRLRRIVLERGLILDNHCSEILVVTKQNTISHQLAALKPVEMRFLLRSSGFAYPKNANVQTLKDLIIQHEVLTSFDEASLMDALTNFEDGCWLPLLFLI